MRPKFYKQSKLLQDYLNEEKGLQSFYAQELHPNWKNLSARVRDKFKQTEVIEELIRQNALSSNPLVKKNCETLQKQNTLVVITGQQLGLMVSPLYVIYKTLSTIKLAKKLNQLANGYNYVPVFWLEGEDHDYEEVSVLTVPDKAGDPKNFVLHEIETDKGKSINKRKFGSDVSDLVQKLKEELLETEFTADLFEKLQEFYKPGNNWLDAFAWHMQDIFKDTGLLFFNAGSKRIKELSKSFFEKIIVENETLVSAFLSQSGLMEEAGYKNQVNIQEDRAYLFLSINDGPRTPLIYKDGAFYLRGKEEPFSLDKILAVLDENPRWFSSTVLTRPLWQSWLLPVVSYIAGAAEISYWGQIKSGFSKAGIVMPHIQPRHTFTLIEPKIQKHLSKYDVHLQDLNQDKETFLKNYFSENKLADVNQVFVEFEDQIRKNRLQIESIVKELDPTLSDPVEKSYSSISSTIEKLHNRMVARVQEKYAMTHNHLNMLHEAVLPNGVLQERVISPIYFENKYGPGWLKKVEEKMDENFSEHIIVYL